MKIIITGATGMVGSEVVRQALADNAIHQVTAIVRKPLSIDHPKLRTIIHKDFLNYKILADTFRENDACLWCLGISQNQVNEHQYIVITYEYAVAAAKAMLEVNPAISFLFLSGDGANSEEKGRFLFGRVKGRTENALLKMPFKRLFIARPAGIAPVHKTTGLTLTLKLQYFLVGLMKHITPSYVISSVSLAKALLHITKNGSDKTILSYKDLNKIAKKIP
jgi:uncharacterized protein YbjT (DUF2867 family)